MPDLTPLSPLMQPVEWQGQMYFTSQYFHQQYNEQKRIEGKPARYREHKNFRQKIRNIENYDKMTTGCNIVELAWESIKSGPAEIFSRFTPLFKAVGYYDLLLLDATAQTELTHHLDDEISKEIAYRHSRSGARQLSQKTSDLLPSELTLRDVKAFAELGQIWGIPPHIVQQETAKYIDTRYGINLRSLLLAAPAQQSIKDNEKMLEPNDLAKALGLSSGMLLNAHLHAAGWQIPRIGGGWEATPTGKPYCTTHAWVAGNKSGYNYKWNLEAVRDALKARGLLPEPPPQQEFTL
jgi:hypothetical protein